MRGRAPAAVGHTGSARDTAPARLPAGVLVSRTIPVPFSYNLSLLWQIHVTKWTMWTVCRDKSVAGRTSACEAATTSNSSTSPTRRDTRPWPPPSRSWPWQAPHCTALVPGTPQPGPLLWPPPQGGLQVHPCWGVSPRPAHGEPLHSGRAMCSALAAPMARGVGGIFRRCVGL